MAMTTFLSSPKQQLQTLPTVYSTSISSQTWRTPYPPHSSASPSCPGSTGTTEPIPPTAMSRTYLIFSSFRCVCLSGSRANFSPSDIRAATMQRHEGLSQWTQTPKLSAWALTAPTTTAWERVAPASALRARSLTTTASSSPTLHTCPLQTVASGQLVSTQHCLCPS